MQNFGGVSKSSKSMALEGQLILNLGQLLVHWKIFTVFTVFFLHFLWALKSNLVHGWLPKRVGCSISRPKQKCSNRDFVDCKP